MRLTWEGEEIGFPRVSATCDFVSPARFQDVLDIAVAIDKIGRKSVTFLFEFALQGKSVARGRITCVCCRFQAGKGLESIEIPASYRARLLASAVA